MMKKVLLTFVLFFTVFFSFGKKTVWVEKKNGENEKFDRINEEHSGNIFESHHKLSCIDPGYEFCVWGQEPYMDYNSDINFVENQIAVGTLTGTIVINGRVITWTGTDANNYNIQIEIP